MSFLAEVISSAEQVQIYEINKKVPELKILIENSRSEVMRYMENVYVKYCGRPKQNRILLSKVEELEQEIKTLITNLQTVTKKELSKSNDEMQKHRMSLDVLNFSIQLLYRLCKINMLFVKFSDLLESKEYLECMKTICILEDQIKETPTDEHVEVIDGLFNTINTKKTMLLEEVINVFTDYVVIENEKDKCTTVKVQKENMHLEQALHALYYKNSVIYSLHSFAKSVWSYIFVPIVDCTVNIDLEENDMYCIMKVKVMDTTAKSDYLQVFSNLKIVLEFLKNHFDLKLSNNINCLEYIGMDIRDNLSELIIKHCLQDTIPSTAEELQKYKVVIEDTKKLEALLKDCKIFMEDTISIFEYANNVNILFINKKCQEFLLASQDIMKKDLHDLVEVGIPYNPEKFLSCQTDQFLRCSISKSTIELLQFAKKIMDQVISASDICAGHLFYTLQNIFRTYSNFVPEYHKKLLQTIPQQVALFHNNCFYIAHILIDWNKSCLTKVAPVLRIETCTFGKEIFQLQKIACEVFHLYVEGQVKQITDIMNESGLEGSTLDKLKPNMEKCIRQCLRQQELLKTVWHKVLSYPIYNKTLGIILNSLCNKIIDSIMKFEDISSNAAEQLVEIIKMILTRGPKLFTDPKEINLYVSSWYKIIELNFVLGASLLEISDRWADGKGPLSLQFTTSELKQLIRALFQNTDRRSTLLAKIQE